MSVVTASDEELQNIIDSAIVNNPFNQCDCSDPQNILFQAVLAMRKKGYRPIFPSEYRQMLIMKQVVKLWIPLKTQIAEGKEDSKSYWDDKISSFVDSSMYISSALDSMTMTETIPSVAVTTSTEFSQQTTDAWHNVTDLHYVPTELTFTYGDDE